MRNVLSVETAAVTATEMESNISNITELMEYSNDSGIHSQNGMTQDQDVEMIKFAAKVLRNVCIPSVVLAGLVGNTLSLLVFSARNMKQCSSSVFLASLAVVDNLFLLNLACIWIDGEFYNILRYSVACEVIMFVTYVTAFLSVWFVVGFTTERFIAICYPLRSQLVCSVFREKIVVVLMIAVACLLYNHTFWTIDIILAGPRYRCILRQEMVDYLQVITWVDTIITMIVPFFSITFMNIRVIIAAATCHKKFKPSCCCDQKTKLITYGNANSRKTLRFISQMRVTRTLVLVSSTFLVLNLPSHVLRLYSLIYTTAHPERHFNVSIQFYFVQEIANFLYYSTFSCNFILYSLFGRHFQKNLRAILKCATSNEDSKAEMVRRISSLRNVTQSTTATSV